MAEMILKDVTMFINGYNISGDMNNLTVTDSANLIDKTTFGSSAKKRIGGIKDLTISAGGFWNAAVGKVDNLVFDRIGSTDSIVSILPNGTAVGQLDYFGSVIDSEYSPGGSIGEMFGFNFTAMGNAPLVRGTIMVQSTLLSSSYSPVIRNLGVRGSTKRLYCVAHITNMSSSGAHSIKVHVEQDNTTTFLGTPSTALVLTPFVGSADIGKAKMVSTQLGSTLDNSYRIDISTSGSTKSSIKGLIALGIF